MRLGLKEAKLDKRTLKLSSYTTREIEVPAQRHWGTKVSVPMLLNDVWGDCAIVGSLHQNKLWIENDGGTYEPTDDMAIEGYRAFGFDPNAGPPGANPTDNGCVLLDVMNYWRKSGIGGNLIGGYASANPLDMRELCVGIEVFGGIQFGVRLPIAIEGADRWPAPPGRRLRGEWQPGSWGGHRVVACGFDQNSRTFDIKSWGREFTADFDFIATYADPGISGEAYVALAAAWVGPDFKAPNGLTLDKLQADLGQFR